MHGDSFNVTKCSQTNFRNFPSSFCKMQIISSKNFGDKTFEMALIFHFTLFQSHKRRPATVLFPNYLCKLHPFTQDMIIENRLAAKNVHLIPSFCRRPLLHQDSLVSRSAWVRGTLHCSALWFKVLKN